MSHKASTGVGKTNIASIGRERSLAGSTARYFRGKLYELRLSRGVKYQRDFAPATTLDSDDDTIALYHFDEGQGDVLTDSSGNEHHGKIFGATWVTGPGLKSLP